MSALLKQARRVKAHVAAVRAKKRQAREPLLPIGTSGLCRFADFVREEWGYGLEPKELGLWLPAHLSTRLARPHRFEVLQLGDQVFYRHRTPTIGRWPGAH
jgi:hypothetical protein